MRAQDNIYDSSDTRELLNPTFTEASTRANIDSQESHSTILGKIKKWFADLKSGAFNDIIQGTYITITTNNTTHETEIKHNDSGVTASSKGDTSNQTPGFGDTFKALSLTVDAQGHLTVVGDHTVKIPTISFATGSANGNISVNINGAGATDIKVKGISDLAFISKGSGSAKFLREDGTWQTDNNTTYTFATGDSNGQIKVTPSGGTAQNVSVKGLGSAAYLTADTAASVNTVARRDSNGYLKAVYYNASNNAENINSYSTNAYIMFKDNNGWQRCTSRLNMAQWLTNENVSTSAGYFVTLTNSWGKFGYTSVADAKTVLGLKDLAYISKGSGSSKFLREDGTWQSAGQTYSAGGGIGISGTTISNTGVRSVTDRVDIGGLPYMRFNVNGSNVDIIPTYAHDSGNAQALASNYFGSGNWLYVRLLGSGNGHPNLVTQNNYRFSVQSDGNLVYYDASDNPIWSSGTSSRRFKHNILDMTEERAKKILNIRPVTFDWNDDQIHTTQQNDNAGVIAEEVSQVLPDLVIYEQNPNDPANNIERSVEYQRFTPYLIKMCQIQQAQIDALIQRVETLEAQL